MSPLWCNVRLFYVVETQLSVPPGFMLCVVLNSENLASEPFTLVVSRYTILVMAHDIVIL